MMKILRGKKTSRRKAEEKSSIKCLDNRSDVGGGQRTKVKTVVLHKKHYGTKIRSRNYSRGIQEAKMGSTL
jgi:hypothetical protein